MPTTKKEDLYFGMMMCLGMVVVMTIYNLYVTGTLETVTLTKLVLQLGAGYVVALLLELFVVGPVAKRIAFSLPFDKSKQRNVILLVSTCMVIGMVLTMSAYGLCAMYLNNSLDTDSLFLHYMSTVSRNFIMAYPLQLLVMGPFIRFLFVRTIKGRVNGKALQTAE